MPTRLHGATVLAALLLTESRHGHAASTLATEAVADTFLTSDPETGTGSSRANADTDNSGYGAMMISANVADPVQGIDHPRTMYVFVAYDMAPIKAGFDAEYGAGRWDIADVSVKFYSNFSIPGIPANNNQFNVPHPGRFTLNWVSNDNWFDPATAGAAGRTQSDFTWNDRVKYLGPASMESVSPDGGFYWAGGDYNGTTACGGGTFAPAAPPCYSSLWPLVRTASLINDIKSGGHVSLMGTPADDQVVYLINQLTKPDAHPQIFVTAEASSGSTPSPTTVPGPSLPPDPSPTPVPMATPGPLNCRNKVPRIDPVQGEWLVRARQSLGLAVTAFDCRGRRVELKADKLPKGASFTQGYDSDLGKLKGLFTWTPQLADVETTKRIKLRAIVKLERGIASSPARIVRIRVLPPATGDSADPVSDTWVSKLVISRAVWRRGANQIDLQGRIGWQKRASRSVRAEAIAQLVRIRDVDSGAQLLEAQARLDGRWKMSIALPQDAAPPAMVEAEFRGKISLPRKVRRVE